MLQNNVSTLQSDVMNMQSQISMLQYDVWNNQYMYGYYYQSDIYMLQNDVSMLQSNVSLKENAANKSTDVTLSDTTNVKFPTELAVKTYVDAQIASGSTTVGAISSTSNSNGATITSGELNLAPANATNGGIVTTADQTFAGAKTFSSDAAQTNVPDINLIVSKTAYNIENTNNFLSVETVIDPFVYSSQGVIIRKDDGAKRGFKLGQEGSYDGDSFFKIASFSDSPDVNRFVISRDNGNVGIGNSSPTEKLEVTGNLKTSGAITGSGFKTPTGTASEYLMADGSVTTSSGGSGGGITAIGAISSTSNSNGATITSGELNLAPANATNGGIVTTADQTFAGNKTFSDGLRVENKPFLPTKLNQSQINSLTGVEEGMVVYNTDTRKLQLYSVGASDAINDSFTGTFTSQYLDHFEQTFIPPTTGIITAIQLFVKSANTYPFADVYVDFSNVSGTGLGSGFNSLNFANPGSPEWMNIPISNIAVTAGQTYRFHVFSMMMNSMFGTNSNYFNGAAMPGCCGPMNGDDVMFKILITPTNGTSAYWLNLN